MVLGIVRPEFALEDDEGPVPCQGLRATANIDGYATKDIIVGKRFTFSDVPITAIYRNTPIIVSVKDGPELARLGLAEAFPDIASRMPAPTFDSVVFRDANGNEALDAEETAMLAVRIRNDGRGVALTSVTLNVLQGGVGVRIGGSCGKELRIAPGASARCEVVFTGAADLTNGQLTGTLRLREAHGFDGEPTAVRVATRALRSPRFVLGDLAVDDDAAGDSFGNGNRTVEPGEQVELTVAFQNVGDGPAAGVTVRFASGDPNVSLHGTTAFASGDLQVGDVASVRLIFSVAKRYDGHPQLPITYEVTETSGRYGTSGQLDVKLRQHAAGDASRGVASDVLVHSTIAVYGLDADGKAVPANAARAINARIEDAVVRSGLHTVLARNDMDRLRREAEFQLSDDCLKEAGFSCYVEIGGAAGARYIITAEAGKIGGRWTLAVKLLDMVSTAAHSTGRGECAGNIECLLDTATHATNEMLGVTE